jgi:cobalt/nickel transport system permease protein
MIQWAEIISLGFFPERIIMHIPDMMLQGTICPATAAIASLGLAGTAYAAYKTKIKPAATFFAGVTALIFAAQMANFPIQLGTSGHLLGATLAVALLGSAFGIMAMSLVVLTQCLVFADGGMSVLGANLLNLALLASLPAVIVREFFTSESHRKLTIVAMTGAAFVSAMLAAGAVAVQLAIAGVYPLQSVLPAMLSVHALIGLGEAGLTAALLVVLSLAVSRVASHRAWMIPLGFAAVIAMVIAPFAATTPDGLESVALSLGFAQQSVAEYTVFTGFMGVALLFAVAYGAGRMLARAK